jgi:hypothetical protein
MKITPRTEQEISEMGVLTPGQYDFEVIHAAEESSKRCGNDMLHLVCRVWPDNGDVPVRVHDYLLDLQFKGMATKLRHFCFVTGLQEEYQRGSLTADAVLGRSGRCEVGIQKDKTGDYEDRNVILDYLPGSAEVRTSRAAIGVAGQLMNSLAPGRDDIPF